jgi:hypothetical protein
MKNYFLRIPFFTAITLLCCFPLTEIVLSQKTTSSTDNVSSSSLKQSVIKQDKPKIPLSIREVNAPVWVGRPPSDAGYGLVRLENGELRHYDYGTQVSPDILSYPDNLPRTYIVSRDQGLTWETKSVPQGHFGADVRSPISGDYMRLMAKTDGVYVIKSKGGIDGEWTIRKVFETGGMNLTRPVVFVRNGKRALVPWDAARRLTSNNNDQVGTFYSDDDGETWQRSNLIDVPPHQPNERDKAIRWQDGASEPTIVELLDGRLWMIIRTAQDNHYQSFSTDGGATWSKPEPSPFYGTLTNPTIGRLRDGRLLFLWNNTTPLPEFPRNEYVAPFVAGNVMDGSGEDMFNNRDVFHAAISDDDGKTWRGFREVFLNPLRNDGNYAETGGIDRSIHQSQYVEVDEGRVVVSVGQHWLHRSILVFNPNWLLETERQCDFANGLDDWSVQGYYNGIRGHCALNRFKSSILVSHPDDSKRYVLQVYNAGRKNVLSPLGGAAWNFPSGNNGFIEVRLRLNEDFGSARICLLDRWLNPTDPTVSMLAMCHLDIAADGACCEGGQIIPGKWHTLRFTWKSTDPGTVCALTLDNKPIGSLPFQRNAQHGLSYIHFQSTSEKADKGMIIESVRAEITPMKLYSTRNDK